MAMRSDAFIKNLLGLPVIACFAVLSLQANPSGETANRPNFILIYTDDQRWDAIGYANPFVRTPNLDRISSQGVRFEQATIVLPVCSPSRAALLTGRYGFANGVTTYHTPLAEGERTFFRFFTKAGYLTAMIGKWHVLPEAAPYSRYGGFMTPGDASPFPAVFDDFEEVRDLGNSRDYWEPLVIVNGERKHMRETTTIEYVIDETIVLIERAAAASRPFAIYLSTLEPHNRMWSQAKDRLSDATTAYYAGNPLEALPAPPNIEDNLEGKPPYLASYRGRVKRVGERGQKPMTPERYRDSVRKVHTLMSEVDLALARLFKVMEAKNLMDNTYVVLMGDNGLFEGEHGLMSKGLHYEEAVRVPFFVLGPGIPPGVDGRSLPTNLDIAPTLLDFAGLEIPDNLHGRSLRSVLENRVPLERDYVLLEHPEVNKTLEIRPAFSLRSRDWKYIRTYENGADKPATFEELYNLREDPFELNNLADHPEQTQRLAAFRDELNHTAQAMQLQGFSR